MTQSASIPSRSIIRHRAAMPARRSAGPVISVPNGPSPAAFSSAAAAGTSPRRSAIDRTRATRSFDSGCIAPHIRTEAPLASGRAVVGRPCTVA